MHQWTNHEEAIICGGSWKPVDDVEFKVFLGVIILIDVYRSNNESVKQLWSTLDGRPIFTRTMSRGRYQQIYAFSNLTMHSQDIIGPLISSNHSEKFETWDSYLRDSYAC